ncbi:MAG: hypothetical protein D5R96_07835 [Methanocalculus sp. MSAO_Arc2]|nr:MAG: hypothetical protein D5R96_07835 [Methanocalculus sp. MSAO_Arc2]
MAECTGTCQNESDFSFKIENYGPPVFHGSGDRIVTCHYGCTDPVKRMFIIQEILTEVGDSMSTAHE